MIGLSEIELAGIAGAYFLGSLSSAIIVCRLMGLGDPRQEGSGNPGATNVKRLYGSKPAAITLLGDMLKGVVPVALANMAGWSPLAIILVGFASFIGHLYPIFFGFRGGKGVATMLGVMFGLSLPIGAAVAGTWLFVAKVLKISSLSALIATALAPLYIYLLADGNMAWVSVTAIMTLILFWRHRSNIERLLKGEEDLIKKQPGASDPKE
ncbi:MAG: glycerol-3-phosphate 1-O-acyltransferase PlsY [Hydrogenovibrio crunogenus]|uniref:Glycerol-3-phosphate acyltransferase n=1 Tax=Hydrogenovibrio crunogenus (strain DSM 25203 / XCL-2) TaxID=317025 RepID=PLSY_HYDCU|nr:RecName: Full=Glycerol-3-phosphate acyltransferase; AltName: Full=Acyl-PO4 G3P acyltransferase; AltName: Full=Acyl-phosphate--glycerol-3-phosphate acyltransferase; AltName: Full=G3P acyltransferase; Short=GPAT; AltName: Full=Lysophosphatidic acid synthase; Short=LPA synthase [Hydrogenovibrio crunogenus XCL-2]MBD3612693.1 glycerol-3-phosphate 1-O-acyltransferase PlsY [Hydrogenovibrio crunogenus]